MEVRNVAHNISEVLAAAEGVTQIWRRIIKKSNSIFQAQLMATKAEQVNRSCQHEGTN